MAHACDVARATQCTMVPYWWFTPQDVGREVKTGVEERAQKGGDVAHTATDKVKAQAGDAKEHAGAALKDVNGQATDAVDAVGAKVQQVQGKVQASGAQGHNASSTSHVPNPLIPVPVWIAHTLLGLHEQLSSMAEW